MIYVKNGKKFNSETSISILEDEYTPPSSDETTITTLFRSGNSNHYWLQKTDENGDNCRVFSLSNEEAFDFVINIGTTYGTGKTAAIIAQKNERLMPGIIAYVSSLEEV